MGSELQDSLILILAAFVLYSIGLYNSRRYNFMESFFCVSIGVILDMAGTLMMYNLSDKPWDWNLHSVLGALAISLMAILSAIGLVAVTFFSDKLRIFFRQALPYAYGVWIISSVTGAMSCLL